MNPTLNLRGVKFFKEYLDAPMQKALVDELRKLTKKAPMFSPQTRSGKKMSVRMTSLGKYGWYSDRRGYRYETRHPMGGDWPPIPGSILEIWNKVTGLERRPDCCLMNHYSEGARMGLHQDRDEADFGWPVVSVSLGDEGLFRVGGPSKGGTTESLWLQSGDVLIMAGDARLLHHGIDRIKFGSSSLLKDGGRLNLTLRVVD